MPWWVLGAPCECWVPGVGCPWWVPGAGCPGGCHVSPVGARCPQWVPGPSVGAGCHSPRSGSLCRPHGRCPRGDRGWGGSGGRGVPGSGCPRSPPGRGSAQLGAQGPHPCSAHGTAAMVAPLGGGGAVWVRVGSRVGGTQLWQLPGSVLAPPSAPQLGGHPRPPLPLTPPQCPQSLTGVAGVQRVLAGVPTVAGGAEAPEGSRAVGADPPVQAGAAPAFIHVQLAAGA